MDVYSRIDEARTRYIEEAEKFANTPTWRVLLSRWGLLKPLWDEEFLSNIESQSTNLPSFGKYKRIKLIELKKKCEEMDESFPIDELEDLNYAVRKYVTGFSW